MDADVAVVAAELRLVLAQILRKLRTDTLLPLAQTVVLARLEAGPATANALARTEHVRPQSMAQTVSELEGAGLVSRRPDPSDGRRILIELTPAGTAALALERARREGWLAEAIEQALSPRDRRALVAALPALRRLVSAGGA